MSLDEREEPKITYRLVVTAAGPNYFGRIEFEGDTVKELAPTFPEVNGVVYERYGDDDEYVEVRFDYVVKRDLMIIKPQTQAAGEDPEVEAIRPERRLVEQGVDADLFRMANEERRQ